MHVRVRRALLPALLAAAFLLLVGWHAVPAGAVSVDPELVAESVSEDGYYVDSSASYLKSDADLDRLREAIESAGRAGVVVLPAGVPTGPVTSRLLAEPNRHTTYVVLSGNRLQAVSNSLPSAKVNGLLAKARTAGNPRSEVFTFLDLLNGKHPTIAPKNKTSSEPSTAASTDTGDVAASATPAAAAKNDSGGGNGMMYAIIGVVVVVLLALGGFILWRRKQGGSGGPGAPGDAGPAAPPAY
jgi:hypothetical protein